MEKEKTDYLTTKELSKILKTPEHLIKKWVREGEMKCHLKLPDGDMRFIQAEVIKELKKKWRL